MANRLRRTAAGLSFADYQITIRVVIGILISLPLVSMSLATIVDSLPAGIVIAGVGAVTLIALLPHERAGRRPRQGR